MPSSNIRKPAIEIVFNGCFDGDLRQRLDVGVIVARNGPDAGGDQWTGQICLCRTGDQPQKGMERGKPVVDPPDPRGPTPR